MRTAPLRLDQLSDDRLSNEAPRDKAPVTPDPIAAPTDDQSSPGGLGRSFALAVALASICVAIFYGVELSHPGPLLSQPTAATSATR